MLKVKVNDNIKGQCVFTPLMDCAGAKIKLLDHMAFYFLIIMQDTLVIKPPVGNTAHTISAKLSNTKLCFM